MLLTILAPTDGSEDLDVPVTVQWYTCGSSNEAYLYVSSDDMFQSVIYMGTSSTGELQIPDDVLEPGNTYFVRVLLPVDGMAMTSNVVRFSVAHAAARFDVPGNGDTLYKGQHITLRPQSWATSYVIEVSSKENTWGRTRFVETLKNSQYETTLPAEQIKVDGKLMVDGTTYYARSKTTYLDFDGNSHTTPYGPTISFVFYCASPEMEVGDVNCDGEINIADVNTLIEMILSGNAAGTGDVNGDGEVNIADINTLISLILAS